MLEVTLRRLARWVVPVLVLAACTGGGDANTWKGIPYSELTMEDFAQIAEENARVSLEIHEALAACLREAGFQATATADDYATVVMGDQREALREAEARCEETLIADGVISPQQEFTTEAKIRNYEWDLASLRCLRELGYELSDPPSLDVYLDQDIPWSPFLEVTERYGLGILDGLERRCPQMPPLRG